MNLQEMKEQLVQWMNDMKHGYRDSILYMEVTVLRDNEEDEDSGRIRIFMYSHTNKYTVIATRDKSGKTYLGAGVSCRKPRAGEYWTRGSDLSDGTFSKDTWIKILGDIVGNELVKIHEVPVKLFDIGRVNEISAEDINDYMSIEIKCEKCKKSLPPLRPDETRYKTGYLCRECRGLPPSGGGICRETHLFRKRRDLPHCPAAYGDK